MAEKKVQCPKCGNIITTTGNPGEVVRLTCPSCGTEGKVTFIKPISKGDAAIEVFNLKKVYGDLVAVNDISFAVRKGEVFGFLGPSGAGKSTTQKIIIGVLKGYEGQVTVLDKELRDQKSGYYNMRMNYLS